jgi:hypothetical protein
MVNTRFSIRDCAATLVAALALLLVSTSLAAASPTVTAADQSRITVQVSAKEIVASGVSPGSDVYLFGGLQVGHGFYSTLMTVDLTASDDDHDGVVRFAYPKGVPLRSVWIAVDQRNGDIGAGVPAGYTLRMSAIPPGAWKRKSGKPTRGAGATRTVWTTTS